MIVKKTRRSIQFLRTTAIGGLLFLLPLIVVAALVSQVAPILLEVSTFLHNYLPDTNSISISTIVSAVLALLVILCFVAGMIARWSISQRLTKLFEKNLLLLFPRYAILKDQMADTIGGEENRPDTQSVLVTLADRQMIGFESERSEDGQKVVVYLPGAPDTWAGSTIIVESSQVITLDRTFGETVSIHENMGRGSLEFIDIKKASP
ncbi:MAG: DUF502 domain-containing protein [Planctomycetota bacterium]|nr:DUF502 domain-containing protein [Planctomycetota bacterium]